MAAKFDWIRIKRDYVEGVVGDEGITWPTLEELSDRYGANARYVRRRAAHEDWTSQRGIYQANIERKRQEKKTDILASKGAEFDAKFLAIAETLGAMIRLRMDELNAAGEDGKPHGADPLEISRLTIAARNAHAMGRIALGESGDGPPLGFPSQFPVYRVPRPNSDLGDEL